MKRNILLSVNIALAIVMLATLAVLIWKCQLLPDQIPTHFDLNGQPNGYSRPSSVFVLWGICALIYGLMLFLQNNPKYIKVQIPLDKDGNPVPLTKGQWQRVKSLNSILVTIATTIPILVILYISMGICQLYEPSQFVVAGSVAVILVAVFVYMKKLKNIQFAEDDYIRTKIESSHTQFLEVADNDILEQLRIINGSEYLPEIKRMKLINDIKSTHVEVTDYIRKSAPNLSEDDITYCLLSSLGLNNNSISACMASSEEALRKRKSRIRKKLPDTLAAYLLEDGKCI